MTNKNRFIISILFLIIFALMLRISYVRAHAAAQDYTQFQPVSAGDLVWLATLTKGEVITVSYLEKNGYEYVEITYTDSEGVISSSDTMLPDKPSSLTITGCNHSLSVVAGITYVGSKPLYMMKMHVDGMIPCTPSSTFNLPLIIR